MIDTRAVAPEFKSSYVARQPNSAGYIEYDAIENGVWQTLYQRQLPIVKDRACATHCEGLKKLNLPQDAVPQLPDVSKAMKNISGWVVVPVAALISHEDFFKLLASRQFPAATFVRRPEELDYVKEPDIFHELFGHCPILTDQTYADFVQAYAAMVLKMDKKDWPLLQRIFWFTVEFGLINTSDGVRAYGGGILSSPSETVYCIESSIPERRPFNAIDIIRTPYRIDALQPIYYVIDSFQQLYDFVHSDIPALLAEARRLGEFAPKFKEDGSANEHIHFC